jgi:hypothetical protein
MMIEIESRHIVMIAVVACVAYLGYLLYDYGLYNLEYGQPYCEEGV